MLLAAGATKTGDAGTGAGTAGAGVVADAGVDTLEEAPCEGVVLDGVPGDVFCGKGRKSSSKARVGSSVMSSAAKGTRSVKNKRTANTAGNVNCADEITQKHFVNNFILLPHYISREILS
jgi:hypothetical protein